MKNKRFPITTLFFITVLLITTFASIFIGYEPTPLKRVFESVKNYDNPDNQIILEILITHRIPRTLICIIAGAGLSICGVAFQTLLRNPLASPYTLGTASFASLGAYIAYLYSDKLFFPWLRVPMSYLMALIFGGTQIILILLLVWRRVRLSTTVLLLTGVTLGMLANSLIMLLRYFALPHKLVFMERWLFGSTQVLGYRPAIICGIVFLFTFLMLLYTSKMLDQYSFDSEIAESRGINVKKLQLTIFFIVSMLTAILVAEIGPIGFVGLIIPHISRYVYGALHFQLIIGSAIIGGTFLLICDVLSRNVFATEIPIGIITTIIGVPVFLYILFTGTSKEWTS
ncbi:MAG: iron ABC transporter permease [Candidatus Hydrogenedentes bacterium]|nr:iron ABC transporter permease [Candidatus Hydrogenedentota bacterium]